MSVMANILTGIAEQGLIYGVLVLGVYISYKILNFPDLSVDGTFSLGGAITAVLITAGVNPWICLLISFGGGLLCGFLVGLMNVKLKISEIVCGIIMMTGLYSVNLRIAGSSLAPIINRETIFNGRLYGFISNISSYGILIIAFILTLGAKLLLDLYLKTKSGMLLKASGSNRNLTESLGQNPDFYKIIGLSLANGLTAFSGSILCQQQKYFEINMGTGMMVMALASVIIGSTVFKKISFMEITTKVIIGSVIYKGCVSLALNLGFSPNDLKLIMAVIFLLVLAFNNFGRVKNADT